MFCAEPGLVVGGGRGRGDVEAVVDRAGGRDRQQGGGGQADDLQRTRGRHAWLLLLHNVRRHRGEAIDFRGCPLTASLTALRFAARRGPTSDSYEAEPPRD